jgi:hypothetical protein
MSLLKQMEVIEILPLTFLNSVLDSMDKKTGKIPITFTNE